MSDGTNDKSSVEAREYRSKEGGASIVFYGGDGASMLRYNAAVVRIGDFDYPAYLCESFSFKVSGVDVVVIWRVDEPEKMFVKVDDEALKFQSHIVHGYPVRVYLHEAVMFALKHMGIDTD